MIFDYLYLIPDASHSPGSPRFEYIANRIDTSFEDFHTLFSHINDFMYNVEIHVFNLDIKLLTLFMWGLLGGVIVFFIRKFLDL